MSAPGYAKPTTSLFVSGLPEDVDETLLARHFERIDRSIRVRLINILRNYQTMRPRGSAIVDFVSPEDAEKALKAVNYTELSGKEINLAWYRPGGIKDRLTANVFVKNLPADFKSKDLFELFSPFGKIFSCRVRYDRKGACRGYGYVQFESKEEADKAIAEMNGKEVRGFKIDVGPFKARELRPSSINMYNNLFVKSIPRKYTNEDLKNLFSSCGEIISAVVIKERPDSQENKGFGFVCFKKSEDAKTAEEKFKDVQIEGQTLYVCRALPLEEHRRRIREERLRVFKDRNVYVKNLPEEISDEELKKGFEQFGQVVSARVMMERREDPSTGKVEFKSKGFGFVCFSNKEEAKKAIDAAREGQQILGRNLIVAIAEKKEDRIAKFSQAMHPMPMGMFPPMYHAPRPRRFHEGRSRPPRPFAPEQMYPYPFPMMGPRGMMPGFQGMPPMGPPMPPMPQMPPYPAQMPIPGPPPMPVPPTESAPSAAEQLPTDKELLGERLYPMVEKLDAKNAAKITGMLLEMEIEQLHGIIQDPAQLDRWVDEARKVLESAPGQ